jgi:hypothetical protein
MLLDHETCMIVNDESGELTSRHFQINHCFLPGKARFYG